MKKIICLLLILSFALPLVGCGKVKVLLNGVNIKDFAIVYSDDDLDYSKRAAEYIQKQILERTKNELPILEDSEESKFKYEIVLGNTNRDISQKLDADTKGLEFAIMADETSIALEGDYFIIAAAAYYFIETYVPVGGGESEIPTDATIHQPITKKADNFILLIGDGMGYYQTKLFDQMTNNLEYGDGEQIFYGYLLPYFAFSRTDSLSGTTDSAAGGTALSSGFKTYNKYIAKDKDGTDVKTLAELAYMLGMSAGVMSTETSIGATPSSFSAHALNRDDDAAIIKAQGEAKKNFGLVMDCGFNYYTARYMKSIESGHIEATLGKLSANKKGFFLMYEEAHIDKHCHNNDMNQAFAAMVRFNQAIGRFMEFAFYNPNTFVLITADHETGGLAPNENGVFTYSTTNHTNANVPIFAYGQGAELFHGTEIENIQIAHTIAALMGYENFGDQSVYRSLTK